MRKFGHYGQICTKCEREMGPAAFQRNGRPECRECLNNYAAQRRAKAIEKQGGDRRPKRCKTCKHVKPAADFLLHSGRYKERRNATCEACLSKARGVARETHRGARARRHLKSRYGLSVKQKEEMIRRQDGRCAICQQLFKSSQHTYVDHNHATGQPRDILCPGCNSGLGHMEKPGFVDRAQAYLARHAGLPQTAP